MFRSLTRLAGGLLVGGCAALVPAGSAISALLSPAQAPEVTDHMEIKLATPIERNTLK